MPEKRPSRVGVKDDLQSYCEQKARKYGITPIEVLQRLIWAGQEAQEFIEMGGAAIGELGKIRRKIKVFDRGKDE